MNSWISTGIVGLLGRVVCVFDDEELAEGRGVVYRHREYYSDRSGACP